MEEYTLYCHVSPSNKKYIGISNNPEKRWNNGKGYNKNYLFKRAIDKYGWNSFKHIILLKHLSIEQAKFFEKFLIATLNLTNPQYGYNLREGGDGPLSSKSKQLMSLARIGNQNSKGRILSEEVKNKISYSLKKYYKTHNGSFKGRHHTEETKQKLREKIVSKETRQKMSQNHADFSGAKNPSAKPIRQLSLDGKILEEFSYASLASKKFNLDLSSIIKCCKGKQKTCGGYKWEYINI